MKSLFNILQKPYPLDLTFKSTVKFAIGISLFVVFFVYLFQMNNWNAPAWYKWLSSAAFGGITLGSIFLNRLLLFGLLGKQFDEASWSVFKEILWVMWNFFSIGCFNFLFAYWMNFIPEVNLFWCYTILLGQITKISFLQILQKLVLLNFNTIRN